MAISTMQHPPDERLIDFILDELTETESRVIREHVEECDTCREHLRKLMAILSTLDEYKDVEPSGNVKKRVLAELGFAGTPEISMLPYDELEKRAKRRRPLLNTLAVAAMLLFAFYLGQVYFPYAIIPRGKLLNARLETPSVASPGSTIPLRFASWDEMAGTPAESPQRNEDVTFSLTSAGKTLIREKIRTGDDGSARKDINLSDIPIGKYDLVAQSSGGHILKTPLDVRKAFEIQLMLNRPIYKPGDEIEARIQAREVNGRAASGAKAVFILKDPLDGLVKHEEKTCDEYGVATFSFPLADLVPLGEYLLLAKIEGDEAARKIIVDDYKLPSFKIELESPSDFVAASQGFTGSVNAQYFFGEPVHQAATRVEYFMVKGDSLDKIFDVNGFTDAKGKFAFSIDPSILQAKYGTQDDVVESYFRIGVEDSANRHEEIIKSFPLAADKILIRVFPEGGLIRTFVTNRMYLLTSTPSGSPVKCDLSLDLESKKTSAQTSDMGVYSFEYIPEKDKAPLVVMADSGDGNKVVKKIMLDANEEFFSFIVRSLKAVYKPGEDLELEIIVPFASQSNVQLDLYRQDHWIASKDISISGTVSKIKWSIQDASGELTIDAALVREPVVYARDRAKVFILSTDKLAVDVSTDQKTYEPGSTATTKVRVSSNSQPQQASIGALASDESIIKSAGKAETSSKLIGKSFLAKLESGLEKDAGAPIDSKSDEYLKAFINAEKTSKEELKPQNVTSYAISPEEIEKRRTSFNLFANRGTILQAFILSILLYLSVILTLVAVIYNIRRGALGLLPLGDKGLNAMKYLAVWGSLSALSFALCLAGQNLFLFGAGLFFMLGFMVSLGGCMRHVDIIADNGTFIQLIASVGIILAALLLSHFWIVYPYLKGLKESNPLMNTAFLGILASIGCMAIVAIFLIPRKRGEE